MLWRFNVAPGAAAPPGGPDSPPDAPDRGSPNDQDRGDGPPGPPSGEGGARREGLATDGDTAPQPTAGPVAQHQAAVVTEKDRQVMQMPRYRRLALCATRMGCRGRCRRQRQHDARLLHDCMRHLTAAGITAGKASRLADRRHAFRWGAGHCRAGLLEGRGPTPTHDLACGKRHWEPEVRELPSAKSASIFEGTTAMTRQLLHRADTQSSPKGREQPRGRRAESSHAAGQHERSSASLPPP